MSEKVYVEVTVKFDKQGNMLPLKILWENDEEFLIDKILDKKRAASTKVGGIGIRYKVKISGKTTFLWYEKPAWFVEKKIQG